MTDNDPIRTTAEAAEAAAMPRARAVHSDPEAPQSAEQKPLPKALSRKPVDQKSPAEWAYERLILYIKNFEEQLDSEHEVAMGYAGSSTGALRIEGMGFFDPDLITFYGSDDAGTKTQLVQHVTQLNVMLRALPKIVPEQAARRIGFRLVDELESSEDT
ncbi:hypothetical protein EDD53_1967 [Pacificibacter maritimus]|uniref:Uncharacterized protein n=1 Tax=Pacificibacter maritimus TaxID=762213 RepID=A0A3N4UMI1_9RHOB|nr:DUF6173 family protein [Pacificibacter maritimus]RPE66267.1 hypothetical protein EDD53_1967 [Pacificibacter maritimus]